MLTCDNAGQLRILSIIRSVVNTGRTFFRGKLVLNSFAINCCRRRYNSLVKTTNLLIRFGRHVTVGVFLLVAAGALFGESETLLERTRKLEALALSLLSEHYRFEEGLLSPDNDRIVIFLSMPHGARVIMDQSFLKIDGTTVVNYGYAAGELLSFQQGGIQLIYAGRIKPGRHTLRFEVKTVQGVVRPMKEYVFVKEDNPKFVHVQIAGYPIREVFAVDW